MKYLKHFQNHQINERTLRDAIVSFLPPLYKNEVSFSEGIKALYGLTQDPLYVMSAMRKRLKKLEAKGELSIDKATHKELRMEMDELELLMSDYYQAIKSLDEKWSSQIEEL